MTNNHQDRVVPKPSLNPRGAGRKPKSVQERTRQVWATIKIGDAVDIERKSGLTIPEFAAQAIIEKMVRDGLKHAPKLETEHL